MANSSSIQENISPKMHNLDITDKNPLKHIFINCFFLCLITSLWFLPKIGPFLQFLDQKIFLLLNKTLSFSLIWQYFWGMLNHPVENWFNLVVMIGINIIAIFLSKKGERKKALLTVLYFWLFFQLTFIGTSLIFSKTLHIHRESPSLILDSFVQLSKALGNEEIKDYSENCFPAGHAMVAIYWFLFTNLLNIKNLNKITIIITILLCSARVFSGAHWASDVVFTYFYAKIWFYSAYLTKVYLSKILKRIPIYAMLRHNQSCTR